MKRFYLATLVIMAAALISMPSTASAANLLSDPGFETGTGWSSWGDSEYSTAHVRTDLQSGHAWTWNNSDGKFEQWVDISPCVDYQASGYLYATQLGSNNGKAWIQVEWFKSDGTTKTGSTILSSYLTTANNKWDLYQTPSATAPSDAAKAKLGYVLMADANHGSNDVWFDDASFEPIPEPTSLLLLGSGLLGLFGLSRKKSAK